MSASEGKHTGNGVLTARTSNEEETPGHREGLSFDKHYEFNVSRYYDFEKGTPSDDSGDKWFFTDAPKGRHSRLKWGRLTLYSLYIDQLTTNPSLYIFITVLITPIDTEGTNTTNEEEGCLPRSTSTNTSSNPSVTTTNDNKQPSIKLTDPHNEELDEYNNQENVAPPPSQAHISSASPVLADMDLNQQHETHHPPAIDSITTTSNIVESNSRPVTRHGTTISHRTGRRRAEILVTAAPTSKHNQRQRQQPPIQPSIPLELLEAARRKGIEMAVERERQMAEEEMRQEKKWQQTQQERASAAAVVINSTMAPVNMKRKKDQEDNNSGRPVTRSQQSSKPLTVPKSPAFMLMGRNAQCNVIKTTEQLELECIEKEKVKEARLRQHNAVTLKTAMAPPPPSHNRNRKQQYTVPEAIQLATAARQRALSIMASSSLSSGLNHHHNVIMKEEVVRTAVEEEAIEAFISAPFNTDMFVTRRSDYYHQNEAGGKRKRAESGRGGGGGTNLQNTQQQQQHQGPTLAKSPNFATKRRARPSRFKPTEQQEFEEMEAARAKRFNDHQQNKLNNNSNSNMIRNHHHHRQQQQQQPLSSSQELHQLDALVSRMHIKPAIVVTGTATKRDQNSVVNRTNTEDASTEKVGAAGETAASKLRRTTLHIGKALRVPVSTIDQQVEYEADQVAADMMNKQE